MDYLKLKPAEFFEKVRTEGAARDLAWKAKFGGKDFECPRCFHAAYYQYRTRPEVRECRQCNKAVRLRPGTLWQNSKLPLLTWLRATYLAMQDKRGVSAFQVRRQLGLKRYDTAWRLLHKLRVAVAQRDELYRLRNTVEVDGAHFHRQATGGGEDDAKILVAIETKQWVDERGRWKERAGFAKVQISRETSIFAQRLADEALEPGTMVNTDGNSAYAGLKGVETDYQVVKGQPEILDSWLPWVHRFISNAKTWLVGTHHGIKAKYLKRYLAEYTYRFNRRHDPDGLFHRAMTACALASYSPERLLFLSPARSG